MELAKTLVKLLVYGALASPVLLILAGIGFARYKSYPVDSFCRDISAADRWGEIVDRAKRRGLFPVEWQGTETIWVFNQEGPPMFRFACSVEFKDGKVQKKEVVDAD